MSNGGLISGAFAITDTSSLATSVMTTKGDLATYSTSRVRIGIGDNSDIFVADSGEATGNKWTANTTSFVLACSDEDTDLTTGEKVVFRVPFQYTVTAVRASLTTAATGGTLLTVDINEGGTSILSTKITIDASETTSTTAATSFVLANDPEILTDDAEMSIDIDAIGSTNPGKGLKVYIIGFRVAH